MKCHEDGTEGHRYTGDNVEQRGRSHKLHGRVKDRVQYRCNDHQKTQRFRIEVVGVHVARGDEPVAFAQQPGPFGKKGAGDGNGQYVKGCKRIGQPIPPDQARMADEGPPGERCRRCCQQKGEKGNRPPGNSVTGRGLFCKVPFEPPVKTVDNIKAQHDINPRGSTHNVFLLCLFVN
jgi:hypothetical protein